MKAPAFIIFSPAADWTPAKAARLTGAVNWLPARTEFRDSMLGELPPAAYRHAPGFGLLFAVGEPYTHTAAGQPVYLWFRAKPVCACRLATEAEIDAELAEFAAARRLPALRLIPRVPSEADLVGTSADGANPKTLCANWRRGCNGVTDGPVNCRLSFCDDCKP